MYLERIFFRGGETVAEKKRIRPKWPWIVGVVAVLVATGVALWLVLCAAPEDTGKTSAPPASAPSASAADLICLEFSSYSGEFVEDGTNEKVNGVVAIRVLNSSAQFLDLATVTYTAGAETATFVITGIPAGEQAWVLEKNRMLWQEDMELVFRNCEATFRTEAVTVPSELAVTAEENTLRAVNNSDKTMENVCVYYKTEYSDGVFLGGIAYMVNFGTIGPGETAEKTAGHWGEDSVIVRYSWQSE